MSSVTFPGSRTVGYTYSNVGNRTTITYPGGSDQVTYGYDEANNLTSVTDWNSNQTTYGYNNAGLLTTVTLPSGTGIVGTYGYDNADRLTSISWVKGGTTTVASVTYTLDDVGVRTQRVDGLGTHTYEYDDLYRLTEVTYPGPSTDTYTYDAVGNRLTKNATSYTYDAADRLTAVGAASYTFDDNGNQTARGSDTFAWDAEDRLTSATVASATTTFAYNGDGLRDSLTFNSNTTTFTWDVAAGIAQVLDDESLRYVYGLGRIAQVEPSTTTHYYLADGLGSTMALVDSSGAAVNTYEYDVFGAVRSSTGSQANAFTFTGEQTDASTGLEYLRARYYDPATGRFLSKDPALLVLGGRAHAYSYANADVVNVVDPLGLWPLPKSLKAATTAVSKAVKNAASSVSSAASSAATAVTSAASTAVSVAESAGKAVAQSIETAAFGVYAGAYQTLGLMGKAPDGVERYAVHIEIGLTVIQATALGLSAAMDYLASGNITNVYNDPATGQRRRSDWWPDWLVQLAGGDPNGCYVPCTKLPGISPTKEGGLQVDFQWPLGK